MATSYDVIYAGLLSKIRDYEWMSLNPDELKELLHDYLRPAIVRFQSCRNNLADRDDELGQFNADLTDEEIEIITDYTVICWLDSNFIRTSVTLKQSMPTKDYQSWSPGNHLEKLENLHRRLVREADTLKTAYGYREYKKNILAAVTGNRAASGRNRRA